MSKQINLSVNDKPIVLDYFVHKFIDHTIGGMLTSLEGIGEIENLDLSIDEAGQVTVNLNNALVPINLFVNEIIKSTVTGMLSPLKGVSEVNKVNISIRS
ncbi:hypothetical protein ACFLWZ_01490 [Chloroflexota bacterium]